MPRAKDQEVCRLSPCAFVKGCSGVTDCQATSNWTLLDLMKEVQVTEVSLQGKPVWLQGQNLAQERVRTARDSYTTPHRSENSRSAQQARSHDPAVSGAGLGTVGGCSQLRIQPQITQAFLDDPLLSHEHWRQYLPYLAPRTTPGRTNRTFLTPGCIETQ